MLGFSGWEPRFSSGLITRTCSRNLLEWTVRHRLAAYSNIRWTTAKCSVYCPTPAKLASPVCGCVIITTHSRTPVPQKKRYKLTVVDASGRNFKRRSG